MATRSFVRSFVEIGMDGGVRFYLVLTKSQPAPLDRLIDRVRTHGDSMEVTATEENGHRRNMLAFLGNDYEIQPFRWTEV